MYLSESLQKNNVAFEGVMAKVLNNKIFKHVREKLDEANLQLGVLRQDIKEHLSGVL